MTYRRIKDLSEEEYALLRKRMDLWMQRSSSPEGGLRAALRSMEIHPIEIERVVGLLPQSAD
jgi:hypothetical protein